MSIKTETKTFTSGCLKQIKRLSNILEHADAVIIGAGAGLSVSAGFEYSGERFNRYFRDFGKKYGFSDMYSGGFYPYKTPEEYWAYWSLYIKCNRYENAPKPVYDELLELMRNKDYFVITTNVDHCFQKAGFDKKRLFYTQGDYGLFQCSGPCHCKTYDNEEIINEMVMRQENMKVPLELVPKCPKCGKTMTVNLRSDDSFVQDKGWYEAAQKYSVFVENHERMHILFLELGVGYNTPGIIKYPFWSMTAKNRGAVYACINNGEAVCPEEIRERSVCIDMDIAEALREVKRVLYGKRA